MKALDAYIDIIVENDVQSVEMPLDIVLEKKDSPEQYITIMKQYEIDKIVKEDGDCYLSIPMICCDDPEKSAEELMRYSAEIEPTQKIQSEKSTMILELEDGTRIQYEPFSCYHCISNDGEKHGFAIVDSRKVLAIPHV